MSMTQCKNGHFYDSSRNAECPYCSPSGTAGVTRPLGGPSAGNYAPAAGLNPTAPVAPMQAPPFPKTAPIGSPAGQAPVIDTAFPKTTPLVTPQTSVTVALQFND